MVAPNLQCKIALLKKVLRSEQVRYRLRPVFEIASESCERCKKELKDFIWEEYYPGDCWFYIY